ncbi:hypothetical protein OAM67_00120 [bacterium]|nr:hypothetical protein [bacterium]
MGAAQTCPEHGYFEHCNQLDASVNIPVDKTHEAFCTSQGFFHTTDTCSDNPNSPTTSTTPTTPTAINPATFSKVVAHLLKDVSDASAKAEKEAQQKLQEQQKAEQKAAEVEKEARAKAVQDANNARAIKERQSAQAATQAAQDARLRISPFFSCVDADKEQHVTNACRSRYGPDAAGRTKGEKGGWQMRAGNSQMCFGYCDVPPQTESVPGVSKPFDCCECDWCDCENLGQDRANKACTETYGAESRVSRGSNGEFAFHVDNANLGTCAAFCYGGSAMNLRSDK